MIEASATILRLGLALAIGFLVGVERGWRDRDVAEGGRAAGLRTYALTGLLGGVAALLGQTFGGWALAVLGAPLALTLIVFKAREQSGEPDVSATSVVAGLTVFGLGALALAGDPRVAAASAVAVAALLASKATLHAWLRRLTWPELRSALVLLAMTCVVLPITPSRGFGPFGAINPAELWLMTIAMAAISFIAYAAIRILGPARGALTASALGALVSSTAVTYALARLERRSSNPAVNAAGMLVAGGVMALRLGAIVLATAPALLALLVVPLGAFAAASMLLGLLFVWRSGHDAPPDEAATLKSPFDLGVVLKFSLVLGIIMALSRVGAGLYGARALLPVAALGGLVDADAVTLASARMTRSGLSLETAAQAILVAAGVDSLCKVLLAVFIGRGRFGVLAAVGTASAAAAAVITWVIIRLA